MKKMESFSLENDPQSWRTGKGHMPQSHLDWWDPELLCPSPRRESLLPWATWMDNSVCLSSGTLRHKGAKSSARPTVLPPIFSGYKGYPQGYGNKSDNASEPTLLGYLVPWIIFCCCSRISSKPKPLVSSGSSKSHGLGTPRLAPPVIRLDLRTRLQALQNSKI